MTKGKKNGNGRDGVEKERLEFRALLACNPNYFGTFPASGQRAVARIKANTKYEEIAGIGYYPELALLVAVIEVKRAAGYLGPPCSRGSFEYVRFFVDWDGDGDYQDPGEDVGIVAVNVHDHPAAEESRPEAVRPISYALRLKVAARRKSCKSPGLVKVRAILSWENPPAEGEADFPLVWGNMVEKWVQVRPGRSGIVDIRHQYGPATVNFDISVPGQEAPAEGSSGPGRPEMANLCRGEDVPAHRYNYGVLKDIVRHINKYPSFLQAFRRDPQFSSIAESVALLLRAKPSTRYEELRNVGLNYDLHQLSATLTIKQPSGYNGDLRTEGSCEYVAFWLQVQAEAEQPCSWRYMGTASLNVHDIKPVPVGGIQYAVYLPADFSFLQQKCGRPQVMRVRAVLSWGERPEPAEPDRLPIWGNRMETLIRVQSGDPVRSDRHRPLVHAVGNMSVANIAGNPSTVQGSALGDGYANGVSLDAGFMAVESPFGGLITVSGKIVPPPDMAPDDKVRYKVQYKKTGGTWKDIRDDFRIGLRVNGTTVGFLEQTADSSGYFRYQAEDALSSIPPQIEVLEDTLAMWHSPAAEGNGLYRLRVLLRFPGAPRQPGVPADHLASSEVKIMVDNSSPHAAITLDTQSWRQVSAGNEIRGKFTATDQHLWQYSFSILPTSAALQFTVHPGFGQYPVLSPPGHAAAPFSLTSADGTPPTGYALRLEVRNRTIVNNQFPGNRAVVDATFSLVADYERTSRLLENKAEDKRKIGTWEQDRELTRSGTGFQFRAGNGER